MKNIIITLCAILLSAAVISPIQAAEKPITYKKALDTIYKKHSDVEDLNDAIKDAKTERDSIRQQSITAKHPDSMDVQRELYFINEQIDTLEIDNGLRNAFKQQAYLAAYPDSLRLQHELWFANKQLDKMEIEKEMLRRSIEFSFRTILANIASAESDLRHMEDVTALSEENLRRTRLLNQNGLAGDNDLLTAEHTHSQNTKQRDALEISLANERQALNKLLQEPFNRQIPIDYDISWEAFPADITAYLKNNRKKDPIEKLMQIDIDIHKREREIIKEKTQTMTTALGNQLKREQDKDLRDREDKRREMEAALRTLAHQREQTLNQRETLTAEKEKAVQNLQTASTKLTAGLMTQYDIEQAELAITTIDNELYKIEYSLWLQQFMFEHCFLLS